MDTLEDAFGRGIGAANNKNLMDAVSKAFDTPIRAVVPIPNGITQEDAKEFIDGLLKKETDSEIMEYCLNSGFTYFDTWIIFDGEDKETLSLDRAILEHLPAS
jgi:hypothetical protein